MRQTELAGSVDELICGGLAARIANDGRSRAGGAAARLAVSMTGPDRGTAMQAGAGAELHEDRPRYASVAFVLVTATLLGFAAALVGIYSGDRFVSSGDRELTGNEVALALVVIAGMAAGARWARRRGPPRVVRVQANGLRVPGLFPSSRSRVIPYSEIESLQLQRVALLRRSFLAIGATRGGPTILFRRFGSRERLRELREAILAEIERSPSGPVRRARVKRRSRADEGALKPPLLTLAVVAGLTALYWISGEEYGLSIAAQNKWARIDALVARGELFRWVTASALHDNIGHLVGNASTLLWYGFLGERVIGWQRMLAIGIASGTLGSALMSLSPGTGWESAFGSSQWSSGWLGAWLWIRVRDGAALPPLFQSRLLVVLACGELVLDWWLADLRTATSHTLGFLLGIGAAELLTRWRAPSSTRVLGVPQERWIGGTSLAVLLGAFVWAEVDAIDGPEHNARLRLHYFLEDIDPASLSRDRLGTHLFVAALAAAEYPVASRSWLEQSARAAERTRELWDATDRPLATLVLVGLRYRLGEFDRAAELAREVEADANHDSELYSSLTTACELGRVRAGGTPIVGEAPPARLVHVRNSGALHVSVDRATREGLAIRAAALRAGTEVAQLRARVPGPIDAGAEIGLEVDDSGTALRDIDEIVTTRIETVAAGSGEPSVQVIPFDPDVWDLLRP